MKTLAVDIESYSSADLKSTGVYRYTEAPDFTILLLAYQYDVLPVKIIDLTDTEIPDHLFSSLCNPDIQKTAWNAAFERRCLAQFLSTPMPPEQWSCTMAYAAQLGLPLTLEKAAEILKLKEQKNAEGKALIKYFSVPCKPTKVNGGRTRNLATHDPEKWERFKQYCIQDVVVEQSIRNKISFFEIPETETRLWNLDQEINDTGVLLDPEFARNAIKLDLTHREKLTKEAIHLTGLENPNSVAQLKEWISAETDSEITTLNKETVPALIENTGCDNVKRLLQIRQEMSKTSIKKYQAMLKAVCSDGRIRGLYQYYGANRTGRWAGRLIQPHNLKKNKLTNLDLSRQLVKEGDLELLELLFVDPRLTYADDSSAFEISSPNIPDILSQLIRTSFVAPPGHRLIVSDLSAIEARIIAWLSGERWRLDVFATHGKIYEASASQMFKIPLEKITKTSDYRNKGKMSELALGYQGGPDAITRIEISNDTHPSKRIPVEELPKLVKMWRNANKAICNYWYYINDAAVNTVQDGKYDQVLTHGIRMFVEKGVFFIQLPGGRRLSYMRPTLTPTQFGMALRYEGMNQTSKQWQKIDTYGGKLVENIVQAVARDVLAEKMLQLNDAGYKIVKHVHDEIVSEMPNGSGSVEEVNKIMSEPLPWAKGLQLKAESFETDYYKKD